MAGQLLSVLTAALATKFTGRGARRRTPAVVGAVNTLNPADKNAGITLSNGNRTGTDTAGANAWIAARAVTSKLTGKWYFEASTGASTPSSNGEVGVALSTVPLTGEPGSSTGASIVGSGGTAISAGTFETAGISAWNLGVGFMQIAVDLDNRAIWYRKVGDANWNANASANPATNVGGFPIPVGTLFPVIGVFANGDQVTLNFGATGFNGSAPAGYSSWN